MTLQEQAQPAVSTTSWPILALRAALISVAAVLITQWLALTLWPALASFPPLESYVRSALFTLVPVLGATAVFAWLKARVPRPRRTFVLVSAVILLLSIIPDYALPIPNKTLLASSVTALLHAVAAVAAVLTLTAKR